MSKNLETLSLISSKINKHLVSNIEFYIDNQYQVILQCGTKNFNDIPLHIKNNKQFMI